MRVVSASSPWCCALLAAALVIACTAGSGGTGGGDDGAGGGGGGGGGDDDTGDDGPGPSSGKPGKGLGDWTGRDDVAASQAPPGGLTVKEAPQFVTLGFDDNGYSGLDGSAGTGALTWAVDMLKKRKNPDGSKVTATFYLTSTYASTWISESPTLVKRAWHNVLDAGFEIGDHTSTHSHGEAFSEAQWTTEIQTCLDFLVKPFKAGEEVGNPDNSAGIGVAKASIYGFRTPFLEYNDAELKVVDKLPFQYDCSIEEGYQDDQDGTNFVWPYTLDHGSPGHQVQLGWDDTTKKPITPHPGLWELPVYVVIVPPDDKCKQYGVAPGLRKKMQKVQSWFDVDGGKITGFDYNLWVSFAMTKAEFLATMKYSLDQHLAGNRAPFMFGAHTDYYSSKYTAPPHASTEERQQAIEEFIDYALKKPQVRVVSAKHVLDWVRNPTRL